MSLVIGQASHGRRTCMCVGEDILPADGDMDVMPKVTNTLITKQETKQEKVRTISFKLNHGG